MTARIVGFVSRAEAGLVGPRSVSRSITPGNGGVSPHYGGPRQPAAEPGADHAICISTWRNWQKYHMGTHGWVDIAYTGGYCNHGYAFAGRGVGVRTAANGTNSGNQNFYAVTWIGGEGQEPTPEAIDALEWWVTELREAGAGRAVKPHRFFKPTGCPGDPLVGQAARLDGADVGAAEPVPPAPRPPVSPTPPRPPAAHAPAFPLRRGYYFGPRNGAAVSVSGYYSHRADLRRWQQRMKDRGWDIGVDGLYGPGTAEVVRKFQTEKRLGVDGLIGPATWAAAWNAAVT